MGESLEAQFWAGGSGQTPEAIPRVGCESGETETLGGPRTLARHHHLASLWGVSGQSADWEGSERCRGGGEHTVDFRSGDV